MTVEHTTGSAKLINLLKGFGHTTPHSSVLEYDTALHVAESQIEKSSLIPYNLQKKKFITIVWGNIDFGEEMLSDKGTTHGTNRIIVQRSDNEDPNPEPAHTIEKMRRGSF